MTCVAVLVREGVDRAVLDVQREGRRIVLDQRIADHLHKSFPLAVKLHCVPVVRIGVCLRERIVIIGQLHLRRAPPQRLHPSRSAVVRFSRRIMEHIGQRRRHRVFVGKFVRYRVIAAAIGSVRLVPAHVVRPEIRDPREHCPVLLLLDRVIAVADVRIVERHRAAHGVEVVPPSAAGTGVDPQSRIPPNQLIPIAQITLYVVIFDRADPILRFRRHKARKRREIEVLPVHTNAGLFDQSVHVVDEPVERRRIAEIK